MIRIAGVALAALVSTTALAQQKPTVCVSIEIPKGAILARDGSWTELSNQQWQFLRGVFVLDPLTPPGLPYGDKAFLAQIKGDAGGLVFFIDGDQACSPMPVPVELVDMLKEISDGTIRHEKDGA